MQEQINGIPNICGEEDYIEKVIKDSRNIRLYENSGIDFSKVKSCASNLLHQQQPLIINSGDKNSLANAEVISNLKWMFDHQDQGDNYNAGPFKWCYERLGDFIPQLVSEGKQPRIMVEYSMSLIHGLIKMGCGDVVDKLKRITCDPQYWNCIEWCGCPANHSVAPSTPPQDFRLAVKAWQHYFCAVFGEEALKRVRGFSPSEMALPNDPDLAYEYVKTLVDCGYQWVLIQEHTVEKLNGSGLDNPHLPHKLVCKNSKGDSVSIIAIIKTQGSDTKLVAQMQPYYEAKSIGKMTLGGIEVPRMVNQTADGENGGVMINEFPPKFHEVVRESSGTETPLVNVSEYLEYLFSLGVAEEDFEKIQPIHQHRIWNNFTVGEGRDKLQEAMEKAKQEDYRVFFDGGSWTQDISWTEGYDHILTPMDKTSKVFYEKVLSKEYATGSQEYREALFYVMCSQQSCYRYWGGDHIFTDYGVEFCRRAEEVINNHF